MMENLEKNIHEHCSRCHRKLKDEQSKIIGYGKICYSKVCNNKSSFLFDLEVTNEITTKRNL